VARSAKVEAERIRQTVWREIAGGDVIPVDPVRIARELGIDVFEAQLDPQISGTIVKEVGQDPTIILNRDDSPVRRRFSAAHELGHYVRRADEPDRYQYVDYRGPLAGEGLNEEEIYANTFAANLLMPEREAMDYRLRNLGVSSGRRAST
jgi:Zn-dependent peptidase ImmA (M78 family)